MQYTPALGLAWFKLSWRALKLQPIAFTGIVVFSLLLSGLLSGVPYIGTLLASLWMPFGSVLTGWAARDTLAGRMPSYRVLGAVFRDRAAVLPLTLTGILASAWMELDLLVLRIIGKDQIALWKVTSEGLDFESVAANFPTTAFIAAFALYLPLLLMTLFAPLLIVERGQSVVKSFFYSFFGTLRAIVPAVVWLLCAGGIAFATFFTVESISMAAGNFVLFTFLSPVLIAAFSALAQAGVWVMYCDIFADGRLEGNSAAPR